MAVACGLLVYMLAVGFVSPWLAIGYVAFWTLFFTRWGISRSPGMLFQAPAYGWFIWVSMQVMPECTPRFALASGCAQPPVAC